MSGLLISTGLLLLLLSLAALTLKKVKPTPSPYYTVRLVDRKGEVFFEGDVVRWSVHEKLDGPRVVEITAVDPKHQPDMAVIHGDV